jgi:hypothetical protein
LAIARHETEVRRAELAGIFEALIIFPQENKQAESARRSR